MFICVRLVCPNVEVLIAFVTSSVSRALKAVLRNIKKYKFVKYNVFQFRTCQVLNKCRGVFK